MSRREQALCTILAALIAFWALRPLQQAAAFSEPPPRPRPQARVVGVTYTSVGGLDSDRDLTEDLKAFEPALEECVRQSARGRGAFTSKVRLSLRITSGKVMEMPDPKRKGIDRAIERCLVRALPTIDLPSYPHVKLDPIIWTVAADVGTQKAVIPPDGPSALDAGSALPSQTFGGY